MQTGKEGGREETNANASSESGGNEGAKTKEILLTKGLDA